MFTVEKANEYLYENRIKCYDKEWRPGYHLAPPIGWMNDPNGLIHFKGEYHVFYQLYPYSSEWGPTHWGHFKSKDLISWELLPVALAPDRSYETHCYSGSAVNNNGIMTLIYTAHHETESPKEIQCIATSNDGIYFTKHLQPVISVHPEDGSEEFRDPKVWMHEGIWYMIVGTCKGNSGKAVLYSSKNLIDWDYKGVIAESGIFGDMWECIDLFKLGDKYVMTFSPMNPVSLEFKKSIFLIGSFNYDLAEFKIESHHEIDYGNDFYAANSFEDEKGRRILIGWMNMWRTKMPTQERGWAGALTIPRTLKLSRDNTVLSEPVEELKLLRENHHTIDFDEVQDNKKGYLKAVKGKYLELMVEFDSQNSDSERFGVIVRASIDCREFTEIYYSRATAEVVIDMKKSGVGECGIAKTVLKLEENENVSFHIFVDASSLEVFCNNGKCVLSNRIYPKEDSVITDLFSVGGNTCLISFDAWNLKTEDYFINSYNHL